MLRRVSRTLFLVIALLRAPLGFPGREVIEVHPIITTIGLSSSQDAENGYIKMRIIVIFTTPHGDCLHSSRRHPHSPSRLVHRENEEGSSSRRLRICVSGAGLFKAGLRPEDNRVIHP